ncbi:hypothetical protein EET67_23320 [Pseudaminobacter arsenicus]|uniref:NTP pyrophosphohydrolase MazG putative catalytic core domain-containing protein n=1 Tax=Borborobacter arsenicus TaxID=1851146 RepID=A0A432UZZ1_9HYPH|nr:hypothetical protein [Pseudaminobacter arsenicus]RUM95418.1 hypothetical protein EET67_23320 [Pseudaminobacter arsenicus]
MVDWLATVKEQGEFATSMAKKVAEALAHPELTIDQAGQICAMVEKAAQRFEQLAGEMDECNLDESLYEVAESIEDVWTAVSLAAVNKIRTMQGFEPIEDGARRYDEDH